MWFTPVVLTEWENCQNLQNHENPHGSSQIIHYWKEEEFIFQNIEYIFESSWGFAYDSHWISQLCTRNFKINNYDIIMTLQSWCQNCDVTWRQVFADSIILWITVSFYMYIGSGWGSIPPCSAGSANHDGKEWLHRHGWSYRVRWNGIPSHTSWGKFYLAVLWLKSMSDVVNDGCMIVRNFFFFA